MTEPKPVYEPDDMRQIEAYVSRFTPCPDVLVDKYGHTTAIVWGKIWRYCQMEEGICRAAIERLCGELGMTDKTVAKHISKLETDGYIKDTTPKVRNIPHVYTDTGKLKLRINIFMEETGTEKFRTRYGKIPYEESTTKGSSETRNIFRVYEENIGTLTSMMSEVLIEAEKQYNPVWITDAILLAVKKNIRNWRYVETILERWDKEGKDAGEGKPEKKEKKKPKVTFVDGRPVLDANDD